MLVLLVNPPEYALPSGTADALSDIGWEVTLATDYGQALAAAREEAIDAVVLADPAGAGGMDGRAEEFGRLITLIEAQRIAAVMLTDEGGRRCAGAGSLLEIVDRDVSVAELRGRLATIERYHGQLRRLERELANMERLGKRLHEHFREVDQEMRLAGRLQRDFLPRVTEPIRNARFATVYRPASWVSGDMFDVFRIDEENTGFYLSDAVGHGMAASLLTMFIKRTITPKRIEGGQYDVLSPSETMAILNDALAAQSLPNCQFVTAWYAVLNHRTLELRYARGGHPFPLLVTPDGHVSELKSSGGLLGLFEGEEFPTSTRQLRPGDKLILYTDGLELAFEQQTAEPSHNAALHAAFASLSKLEIREMMRRIEAHLDDVMGSLAPRDDVTLVGLEILP